MPVVKVMLSQVIINWTEPSDFLKPSDGYKGVIICEPNECEPVEYNQTINNSQTLITIGYTSYLTTNCTLELFGFYGETQHQLTTPELELNGTVQISIIVTIIFVFNFLYACSAIIATRKRHCCTCQFFVYEYNMGHKTLPPTI